MVLNINCKFDHCYIIKGHKWELLQCNIDCYHSLSRPEIYQLDITNHGEFHVVQRVLSRIWEFETIPASSESWTILASLISSETSDDIVKIVISIMISNSQILDMYEFKLKWAFWNSHKILVIKWRPDEEMLDLTTIIIFVAVFLLGIWITQPKDKWKLPPGNAIIA